jgi:nitroreductase
VLDGADPVAAEEDLLAAGCATYALLLGAHARGLAAYWRTPAVLRADAGRAALGLGEEERAIALVHLGPLRQEKVPPERAPAADVVTYLD